MQTVCVPTLSVFCWFESGARDAYLRYHEVFGTGTVDAPEPFHAGTVELPGLTLQVFNGGPHHSFNDAISLFVSVETQEEIDRISDGLIAGGGEQRQCGWLRDAFGVSWQVIPTRLGALLGNPDRDAAGRVHQAMLTMHRLDLAALEAAASA